MIDWKSGVFGVTVVLASSAAVARDRQQVEVGAGILQHGITPPFNRDAPAGTIYESTEEQGSVDVQLLYRTPALGFALRPRLTAKAQINTRGRTSFVSAGAEWRRRALNGRVYAQIGVGVAVHDGRLFNPDPYAPGLSREDAWRQYTIYTTRTAFGSRVLFNPNLSIGARLDRRWAVEAAYEHFSHAQIFNAQNSGIDNVGIRLIRSFGR